MVLIGLKSVKAIIFDLDGTLVQTEILKANSYALAAIDLSYGKITENEVIEDSPAGVKAALNAGMGCLVVTTEYTRKAIHNSRLVPDQWIEDNPAELLQTAQKFIDKQGNA